MRSLPRRCKYCTMCDCITLFLGKMIGCLQRATASHFGVAPSRQTSNRALLLAPPPPPSLPRLSEAWAREYQPTRKCLQRLPWRVTAYLSFLPASLPCLAAAAASTFFVFDQYKMIWKKIIKLRQVARMKPDMTAERRGLQMEACV